MNYKRFACHEKNSLLKEYNNITSYCEQTEVYRFKVTVDDLLFVQHLEALEQWMSKAANQTQTEALEIVLLDQLIQVCPVKKADR